MNLKFVTSIKKQLNLLHTRNFNYWLVYLIDKFKAFKLYVVVGSKFELKIIF